MDVFKNSFKFLRSYKILCVEGSKWVYVPVDLFADLILDYISLFLLDFSHERLISKTI